MDYKHFGYFLAVCILVFGTVLGWMIRMLILEKKINKRFDFLMNKKKEKKNSKTSI